MSLPLKRRLGTGMSYAIPVFLGLLIPHVPSGVDGLLLMGVILTALGRTTLEAALWNWLAPYAVCKACGHTFPTLARYKCNCGYIAPKIRHAFSPCPLCKKGGFRWLVCPFCEGSIVI